MKPLNYRHAEIDWNDLQSNKDRCEICSFNLNGQCSKYQYIINLHMICDSFVDKDQTYCMSCGQKYSDKVNNCPYCGIKNTIRLNLVLDKKEKQKWSTFCWLFPLIFFSIYFVPFSVFGWIIMLMAYFDKDKPATKDW